MLRWSFALLAAATLLCSGRTASAFTYGDTLTLIWKPLPNLPAIVRPGDTLTVWSNAPSTASSFEAKLHFSGVEIPLVEAGGGWRDELARWVLRYRVPAKLSSGDVPEELYDLSLTCKSCAPDVARNAVKVIPSFRDDFYFAQISDTHMPSHPFSSQPGFSVADSSGLLDFDAVAADLNLLHPEFVLHTGDLVNEAELEEHLDAHEMGRAVERMTQLEVPMFITSGNHDLGGWQKTPPPDGTARRNWWRYLGWPFLLDPPPGDPRHTQDFTFDYGPLHVIGLESYINDGPYDHYRQDVWGSASFTADQMSWLQADLAAVPPGRGKLLFYHYDFSKQILPDSLGLDGAIWGHHHSVPEGDRAARPFNLGVQSVIGRRVFRIFRVQNGVITPGPMHSSGWAGAVDSMSIAWSGPNDGTSSALTATVTNRFGEAWEHARLVFWMANSELGFDVTGGTLRQIVKAAGGARVYVDCPLAASSVTTVVVSAARRPDAPTGLTTSP